MYISHLYHITMHPRSTSGGPHLKILLNMVTPQGSLYTRHGIRLVTNIYQIY